MNAVLQTLHTWPCIVLQTLHRRVDNVLPTYHTDLQGQEWTGRFVSCACVQRPFKFEAMAQHGTAVDAAQHRELLPRADTAGQTWNLFLRRVLGHDPRGVMESLPKFRKSTFRMDMGLYMGTTI